MNVLLVTESRRLSGELAILNPEIDYCAIVVDDIESSKKVLECVGLPQDLLHPVNELKACVEKFDYDYILRLQAGRYSGGRFVNELIKFGASKDKVLNFNDLLTDENFSIEMALRYFEEHAQDFKIVATGASAFSEGLDITRFKRKVFKFSKPSQDLYYQYKIIKHVVLCGGGHSTLRYALININNYHFHYDLSSTISVRNLVLPYFIAFNDLHNLQIPVEIYGSFFNKDWLAKKLPLSLFDTNNFSYKWVKGMDQKAINATPNNLWLGKYYPETRDENVKILNYCLIFCVENDIRPVLIRTPATKEFITKADKRLAEEFLVFIEQACQKHPSAIFIDGWKLENLTYADFNDHVHLNRYGAAKFSAYLNDFIERLEKQGG